MITIYFNLKSVFLVFFLFARFQMLFQFQKGKDFRKEKINTQMIKMDQNQQNHTDIRQQDAQLIQSKSDSDLAMKITQNQQRPAQNSKEQKNKKWNNQQYIRYIIFLISYKNNYGDLISGQKMKWYSLMSEAIGNTNYNCCRSYHGNFLQKFKNIKGIIDYLTFKVCYEFIDLVEQVKRIRQIINKERNNKIQILQKLLQQQSKKQHVKILNKSQINCSFLSPIEFNKIKETKLFIQEQNLTDKIRRIIVPVELLIIVKRKSNLKDIQQSNQLKQIDEITKKFQNDKKIYIKMRKFITHRSIKKSKGQNYKKNKVIDKIINDKQRKLNEQKIYQSQQQIYKQIENQVPSKFACKKQRTFWTKFQMIKLIVFLHIMKQKMQNQNLQQIDKINSKCVQYINTDITLVDANFKIHKLKRRYQNQFWSTGIEKETARFQIPQSYIEREKQRYLYEEKNPPKCSLHLQCKKIELKVPSNHSQEDLNDLIDKQLKQKFRMIVGLRLNHFDREVLQKKQNQNEKKQNQNVEISSKKVKQILHLELSKYLFRIYKNSFRFLHQTKNLLTNVFNVNVQMIIKQ